MMKIIFRTMAPMACLIGNTLAKVESSQLNWLPVANMDYAMNRYLKMIGQSEPTLDDIEGIANMVMTRWWTVVRNEFDLNEVFPHDDYAGDWEIKAKMRDLVKEIIVDVKIFGALEWLYNNHMPILDGFKPEMLQWDQETFERLKKALDEEVDNTLQAIDKSMNKL